MSAKTLYVTVDGLVYNGRSYRRGDVIALDKATEQLLLEDDRVSTKEPKPEVTVTDDGSGATVTVEAPTIADFSDEDLLAAVAERGIAPAPAPFDYDSLKVDQLEQLIEARKAALEVKGTGNNGDVVKADLVKTLTDADAALAS